MEEQVTAQRLIRKYIDELATMSHRALVAEAELSEARALIEALRSRDQTTDNNEFLEGDSDA